MASGRSSGQGTTKHCCWGTCHSDSRYPGKLPEGTFFIGFPKPGRKRENMSKLERDEFQRKNEITRRWLHACGRKNFSKLENVKKDTYMCSLHFVGGRGPTPEHPDPIIATLIEEEQTRRLGRKRKLPTRTTAVCLSSNEVGLSHTQPTCSDAEHLSAPAGPSHPDETVELPEHALVDKETQTVFCKAGLSALIQTIALKNTSVTALPLSPSHSGDLTSCEQSLMSPDVILNDEKQCKYFIGLTPKQFDVLFVFLGPAKYELTYWGGTAQNEKGKKLVPKDVPVKTQLFISLLRLRRGFNLTTIAYMYGISNSVIGRIFTTWIQFLYHHFKDLDCLMFPTRQDMRATLPSVFKPFKNIRCSVDCTEFKCQMPTDYAQQGNMYSSYKHHTTMKCLIAVTPTGCACFVSDLYEGSIGDVQMFEDCGILKHINPGDSLLVDRDFTVQDSLLSKQATIFIPPFLGKRSELTKEEELLTKRIARAIIHAERFNERLKKFRLVDGIIPLQFCDLASQLVFVACCLVNFQECLCK